jgi:hypothetical protein
MVEMKGKGQLPSYWLEASEHNELVNAKALEKLDSELVKEVKGMKDTPKARQVTDTTVKSLEEHITGGNSTVVNSSTGKGDIDDSKSCGFSRSSSASNMTPSRKELARMLARSFPDSASRGSNSSRSSQRKSRLQRARNDICRVLEVVEQADAVTSAV